VPETLPQRLDRSALLGQPSLRCVGCGSAPGSAGGDFRCEECGELFEIVFTRGEASAVAGAQVRTVWLQRRLSPAGLDQSGVWRFRELLPVKFDDPVTLREGNTPLYPLPRCARAAGVDTLLAKHQGMNPTGSFKDTGMTVALSVARATGFRWVACASTGNTSASMAAYAARANMGSLVLIPEGKIAWGKLAQALDYGAVTCQLRTDFDGCMRVLGRVVRRMRIYLVNSLNPYRIEGQKTAAVELMEQLDWNVPDHVIVPGGNLANSSSLGKAFAELRDAGLIARLPKISIVQAAGANPLVRAMHASAGERLEPVKAETLATAIRIGNPASWRKAVRILRQSGGACEDVTEAEIAIAKAEIGADGIGCEPASAVTLAGLKKLVARAFVKRGETVVLVLTGHLLKDPDYTLKFHRGELLPPTAAGDESAWQRQMRPPVVLEADADAVIEQIRRAEADLLG
jgi:threonine synthase